jgi:hypothetical protein
MVKMKPLNAFLFLLVAFPSSPVSYDIHPKALISSKSYHVIINTNIPFNRMITYAGGNVKKYVEGESITARRKSGG